MHPRTRIGFSLLLLFLLAISPSPAQVSCVSRKAYPLSDHTECSVKKIDLGKVQTQSYQSGTNRKLDFSQIQTRPDNSITDKVRFVPLKNNAESIPAKPFLLNSAGFKTRDDLAFPIRYLDISSNFPDNTVRSVCESKDGSVWIACKGAVVRMRSNSMMVYNNQSGLPEYPITKIINYQERIFVGTFGGGLYEIANDTIRIYNQKSGFISDLILDMSTDGNELFIGTYGAGLLKLNGHSFFKIESTHFTEKIISSVVSANGKTFFVLPSSGYAVLENSILSFFQSGFGLPTDSYEYIAVDPFNAVYLGAADNFLIRISDGLITSYKSLRTEKNHVENLLATADGGVWVSTAQDGLYKVSEDSYYAISRNSGLSDYEINSVFQDSYDNLWIATVNGGVNLLSPGNFQNIGSENHAIASLCVSESNELIYQSSPGVLTFKSKDGGVDYHHAAFTGITGIAFDSVSNSYWITSRSGFYQLSGTSLYQYEIRNAGEKVQSFLGVLSDKRGVWISTYNFGLLRMTGGTVHLYSHWVSDKNTLVFSAFRDQSARIWICSEKSNLSYISGDSLVNYKITVKGHETRFRQATEAEKGELFFATNNGLISYSGNKFSLVDIPLLKNMPAINSVFYDPFEKKLWLATPNSLIAKDSLGAFHLFNYLNGIASSAFNPGAVVQDQSNIIYWANARGILAYQGFRVKTVQAKRKITLDHIAVLREDLSFEDLHKQKNADYEKIENGIPYGLQLSQEFNSLVLRFNCINWGKEANTAYYYNLNNAGWVYFGNTGELRLQNLSYGKYECRIKAELGDDATAEELVYSFEISKPLYLQNWFLLLVFGILIFTFWIVIFRLRLFNFDNIQVAGNNGYLLLKVRVLAIANIILLLAVDYIHAEITERYHVNWTLNIAVSVFTLVVFAYSFYKNASLRFLSFVLQLSFYLLNFFYFFRAYTNQFEPIISIEAGVAVFFSIVIFPNLRRVYIFSAGSVVFALLLVANSNAPADLRSLFFTSIVQVIIAVLFFYYLERKNLAKVLFSEKLLLNSKQFVIVSNKNAEIIFINDFMAESLGFNVNDVTGKAWWSFRGWDEEKVKEVRLRLIAQIKEGRTERYVNTIFNPKLNKLFYIEWQDTPIDSEYVMGLGKDVTVETIQKNELEKLSLVARSVTNGVVITDTENRIEWANDSFLQLTGYNSEEMIGKVPIEMLSGPMTDSALKADIRAGVSANSFEILQYSKSGKPIWLLVNTTPIVDAQEKLIRKIHVVTDITETKKLTNRFNYILNNAVDIIYTCNIKGEFTFINEAVVNVIGYQPAEMIGHHYSSVIHEDDLNAIVAFYSNIEERNEDRTYKEFRIRTKSGETRWIAQTVNFIVNDYGEVDGFQAIARDITFLHTIQQEKDQQQEEQNRFLKVLTEISFSPLDNWNTVGSYGDFICNMTASALRIERVSIWKYQQPNLICLSANDYGTNREMVAETISENEYPNYFAAIRKGIALPVNDVRKNEDVKDFLGNYFDVHEIKSMLDVPVWDNAALFGTVCCESTAEIRNWSDAEINFVKSISDLLALANESFKRKEAEKQIHLSESNFRLLNETIDDVFWLIDVATKKVIYISPSCRTVLGPEPEDFYHTNNFWTNYVLDEDKEMILAAHKLIEENGFYDIEYRIKSAEGKIKWIHEKSFGIRDENGVIVRSSGVCSDITLEKETSLALAVSENNFRLINESLRDVFYLYDIVGSRYDYISPNCQEVLGVPDSYFYNGGSYNSEFVLPEDKPIVFNANQEVNQGGEYVIEYRINAAGTIKWVREKSTPILNSEGIAIKNSGSLSDISAQKHAEQQIRQLSLVAEKTQNGILICDPDGKAVWANQAYLEMMEIPEEQLLGRNPRTIFKPGDEEFSSEMDKINGTAFTVELEGLTYLKKTVWLEVSSTPVYDEKGVLVQQIEVVTDISERRQREQIIESQTLDIIGSINYAKRIQDALLPRESYIHSLPVELELYYKPKDIIGGDFYWMHQVGDKVIIAIADCTGHGVPGALMTSLGINGLINIVTEQRQTDPAAILTYLDDYIYGLLATNSERVTDGMDVGIVSIDVRNKTVEFAGAGRSLFLYKNAEMIKLSGSRKSIGSKALDLKFENQLVSETDGLLFYLFSDGMTDQFGGPAHRRIGSKGLNDFLIQIAGLELKEQKSRLIQFYDEWAFETTQTDDMIWCVFKT